MAGRTRRLDGQKRRMTMTYGAFLLLFLVTPIAVLAGVLRRRLLLRRFMLPALALPLLALATGALGPHRRRLGPVDVCTGPHLGRALVGRAAGGVSLLPARSAARSARD